MPMGRHPVNQFLHHRPIMRMGETQAQSAVFSHTPQDHEPRVIPIIDPTVVANRHNLLIQSPIRQIRIMLMGLLEWDKFQPDPASLSHQPSFEFTAQTALPIKENRQFLQFERFHVLE